ncbi:hypothetical protein SAY86_000729 [Trapa natans]|uniref:BHLH domain-containing protein n=1 Tax=Trapa natans TaxID=22666 RepID=A0AAN7MFH0_TRANT|nr:hypothetical protein SAY86_000729 [Trapa natans]
MYAEDNGCFDPNDPYSAIGGDVGDCVGFSQALQTMRLHDSSVVPLPSSNMGNCCDGDDHNGQFVQEMMIHSGGGGDSVSVPNNLSNGGALSFGDHHQAAADGNGWGDYQQVDLPDMAHGFDGNGVGPVMLTDGQTPMIAPAPDLLDLFHSLPPRTPSFEALPMGAYDPLLHLTPHPPPPQPLMRDLFQSLPQGCYHRGGANSFFSDEGDESGGMMYHQNHHHQDPESGVLKFGRDISVCLGKRERKAAKHFTTDKEKRCQMNDKFAILMSLIPNPTKTDRASVVGDAIEYIKELLRTVNELKLLVDKKRCGRESRRKRHKAEEGDVVVESCVSDKQQLPLGGGGGGGGEPVDHSYSSNTLRSSWLQRKSKVTEVDVRIIDDEVTIKLVQRKKINCLLYVSRVLDELQLDLQHVAGGHIGEHYSFLFNSKIYEGSSVFASAIASKLIEAVDAQYTMHRPSGSY